MTAQGPDRALRRLGFAPRPNRAGAFLLQDTEILQSKTAHPAVEILPLGYALKTYPELEERMFKLVLANQDEYTRRAASGPPLGYFIRVRAGEKVVLPVQTCFLIQSERMEQVVHNLAIIEAGAEAHFINGCVSNAHILKGMHVGVSEYFVEPGATLTSTMIHSWGPEVEVYPRSATQVGDGGRFISTYVAMTRVKRVQMAPAIHLGQDAVGELYSILYAPPGSELDVGGVVWLDGPGARTDVESRAVSDGGRIWTRGLIVGNADESGGAMACNGLLVNSSGMIHAIPELIANTPRVRLSHEASVGMISEEELGYLMASGIPRERARELIIQGFLDLEVPGLPEELKRRMKALVERTKKAQTI